MQATSIGISTFQDIRSYIDLMKFRLSFFVVFSGVVGFLLAPREFYLDSTLLCFAIGSFFVTSSANAINQLLESEFDKKMSRTLARPLPSSRLNEIQAGIFATTTFLFGSFLLMFGVNLYSCLLSAISLFLYAFVYTPLKRFGSVAVFVGAFPGALPPLIGWVAATNSLSIQAFILFFLQFVWQFPHFWSIAWILDEDYKRAGFRLLPFKGGKNFKTAFQIMFYTLLLIPIGFLPLWIGLTGINSAIIVTIVGILFLVQTIRLVKDCSDNKIAKQVMFTSFVYLSIVQIAYLLDKI